MLYIALLIAIGFYGALYLLWNAMEPHLSRPAASLAWLRSLIFQVPDAGALLLLKEVILLTALYLAADFVIASTRRALRRRARRPSAFRRVTLE